MEEQESIGAKKVSLTPLTICRERESKRDRFPNLSPRKRKDISIGKERTSFYLLIFGKKLLSVIFFPCRRETILLGSKMLELSCESGL